VTSDPTGRVSAVEILESAESPTTGERRQKFLYLAALFHGSAGVAMWGDLTVKKQFTVLGGMEVGMRLDGPRMAFELGLSAGYGEFLVGDIAGSTADYSRWNMLLLGLVPRFSFPLGADGWFAGFEFELGYVMSTLNYAYLALRGHLAYAFQPWLELRLNLLGADWMQELAAKATLIAYNGNLALVVRFP
jgi:hypothetical protein